MAELWSYEDPLRAEGKVLCGVPMPTEKPANPARKPRAKKAADAPAKKPAK